MNHQTLSLALAATVLAWPCPTFAAEPTEAVTLLGGSVAPPGLEVLIKDIGRRALVEVGKDPVRITTTWLFSSCGFVPFNPDNHWADDLSLEDARYEVVDVLEPFKDQTSYCKEFKFKADGSYVVEPDGSFACAAPTKLDVWMVNCKVRVTADVERKRWEPNLGADDEQVRALLGTSGATKAQVLWQLAQADPAAASAYGAWTAQRFPGEVRETKVVVLLKKEEAQRINAVVGAPRARAKVNGLATGR